MPERFALSAVGHDGAISTAPERSVVVLDDGGKAAAIFEGLEEEGDVVAVAEAYAA